MTDDLHCVSLYGGVSYGPQVCRRSGLVCSFWERRCDASERKNNKSTKCLGYTCRQGYPQAGVKAERVGVVWAKFVIT